MRFRGLNFSFCLGGGRAKIYVFGRLEKKYDDLLRKRVYKGFKRLKKGGKEDIFYCTWRKNMIFEKRERGGDKNINIFDNLHPCVLGSRKVSILKLFRTDCNILYISMYKLSIKPVPTFSKFLFSLFDIKLLIFITDFEKKKVYFTVLWDDKVYFSVLWFSKVYFTVLWFSKVYFTVLWDSKVYFTVL